MARKGVEVALSLSLTLEDSKSADGSCLCLRSVWRYPFELRTVQFDE